MVLRDEVGDIALATECANLLHTHYPGHAWAVNADCKQSGGVMTICNLNISERYGYVLKLSRVYADPDRKCVVLAGGEMLERAGMLRGWLDEDKELKHVEGIRPQDQPLPGGIII